MTIAEVAKELGKNEKTIRKYIEQGQLTETKTGAITKQSFDKFTASLDDTKFIEIKEAVKKYDRTYSWFIGKKKTLPFIIKFNKTYFAISDIEKAIEEGNKKYRRGKNYISKGKTKTICVSVTLDNYTHLMNYMEENKISSRSKAVQIIIKKFFEKERLKK